MLDYCRPHIAAALLALSALMLSGCASSDMRGTPYYTTPPDTSPQATKERIPLWPVVYYQDPTLSVLWPFFEKSDEFMALRPLASVYGLQDQNKIYSLLWPLGEFNRVTKDNRFFPVFWGDHYFVGFPLYWHLDRPLSKEGGLDALLPLWWYSSDRQGYSFNLVWPFINVQNHAGESGWRVWPLLGAYSKDDHDYYRFAAWPLAHQWGSSSPRETGEAVLPLYLRYTTPSEHCFYSLLYSSGTSTDQHKAWQLLLPLYYSSRENEEHSVYTLLGGMRKETNGLAWVAVPLLSGGSQTPDSGSTWLVGPLAHFSHSPGTAKSHILPLYYASTNQSGHTFVSLPWSSGSTAHGQDWQLCFPLYYRNDSPAGKTFATLLGGWQTGPDGRNWLIWPLLSGGRRSADSLDYWLVAPMFHARWDQAGLSSHLLPLYWWNAHDKTLLSLLYSKWGSPESGRTTTVVPPALTLYSATPEKKDLWTVAGAAHFSWGEKAGASHVFPLYYQDKRNDTFVSLPYAHWNDAQEEHDLYPPLLSMYSHTGSAKRLDALLGLFSERWGDDQHEGYCLPLYYHDKWDKFYTLLFGWDRDKDNGFFYPLTPLLGVRTGQHAGGWLFPLWSRDHDKRSQETTGNLLWGSYKFRGDYTESSIFPLYSYQNRGNIPATFTTNSWGGHYGKTFWSLPAIWYRNTTDITQHRGDQGRTTGKMEQAHYFDHGCFPLWTYTHKNTPYGGDEKFGTFLLCLYDYKSTLKAQNTTSGQTADEHVRKQILWRLYHYERKNKDVTVDIFPAMTYDQTGDDYKRWSFLWRAFRYERGPDGKKLDLLFIPLMR